VIKTVFLALLVAANSEQADLVFSDGENSCIISKTEGTQKVHVKA
jgi:hypothetical protein